MISNIYEPGRSRWPLKFWAGEIIPPQMRLGALTKDRGQG